MYFVSLNLRDLPQSGLRERVLNIPTSFYLPAHDVNNLKEAGRVLLSRSDEYRRLTKDLALPEPAPAPIPEPETAGGKDAGKSKETPPEQAASAAM